MYDIPRPGLKRRIRRFAYRAAKKIAPNQVVGERRKFATVQGPLANSQLLGLDGIVPDFCQPLDDPTFRTVDDAGYMQDDDAVLGFADEGNAWAFPWWIMKNHHLVNLYLNDQPRFVAFCEACSTGAVYDPVVDGTRYTFGIKGYYNGGTAASDHQTGSLWSVVLGAPVHGPATEAVTRLTRLPVVQETWGAWKGQYPETLVLEGAGEPRDGHGSRQPNPDHTALNTFQGTGPTEFDPRVAPLDLIAAVMAPSEPRAYPLESTHQQGGLVHDQIGDLPVVVVTKPGSWLAVAFDRRVGDEALEFRWEGDRLVDTATESTWDLFGKAVAGPHEGTQLDFVRSGLEKWYGWAPFHAADAKVWSPDGLIAAP